jgi:agmatine/peptidylarginine deiminase
MTTVLPAEWAPQDAVQLTWPRADGDFARWFDEVERNFLAIAVAIARYEPLLVATAGEARALHQRLTRAGVPSRRLRVYPVPGNDVWARDYGPITVFRNREPVHLDFTFNGWGGKFEAGDDNRITRRLAEQEAWNAPVETIDFVLEGGAIDTDGAGTLLTTERCLLAPTRNPGLSKAQVEEKLKQWLGLARILWLRRGDLLGDDTDGHIDTVARFCDPGTIAYQACDDRSDAHYEELAAMAAELAALRDPWGKPYRLVPLPLPEPIHDADGRRLPAGYPNFLIVNGGVLVPTYGCDADAVALQRLRPCFPGRELIGIDCRALIHQYGSLHCVTMQIPRSPVSS